MRHAIVILTLLIPYSGLCQSIVSKKEAIQIAINHGIAEPLDSFEVTLANDTIWEVKSLFCDQDGFSQTETYRINAITGEKYKENFGTITMVIGFDNSVPKTKINFNDYADSLIPVNEHQPKLLVPDAFDYVYNLTFSPDNQWIAFDYQPRSIAIVSIDGRYYRKICDDCLNARWPEEKNVLVYEKECKFIHEYNVSTQEVREIADLGNKYLKCFHSSTNDWLAFVKDVPRQSANPNEIIITYDNQASDLFILNLHNGQEKRITTEGYVSGPWWNSTGDTVFFYMNNIPYYAAGFDSGLPCYGHARHLQNISISDYLKCVDGRFPYIQNCQILLVDRFTMKPMKFILKKRGRYYNPIISNDGKLVVFIEKNQNKYMIYLVEIKS